MNIKEALKRAALPKIPADKANHFIYGFAIYISKLFIKFYASLNKYLQKRCRHDYSKWDIMDVSTVPSLTLILI
jgi:hypothetical protein